MSGKPKNKGGRLIVPPLLMTNSKKNKVLYLVSF